MSQNTGQDHDYCDWEEDPVAGLVVSPAMSRRLSWQGVHTRAQDHGGSAALLGRPCLRGVEELPCKQYGACLCCVEVSTFNGGVLVVQLHMQLRHEPRIPRYA